MDKSKLDLVFLDKLCKGCNIDYRILENQNKFSPSLKGEYIILGKNKNLVNDESLIVNDILYPDVKDDITFTVAAIKITGRSPMDVYHLVSEFCNSAQLHHETMRERAIMPPQKISKKCLEILQELYALAKNGLYTNNNTAYYKSLNQFIGKMQLGCVPGNYIYNRENPDCAHKKYNKNNRVALKKFVSQCCEISKITLEGKDEYKNFIKVMKKNKDILYWCKKPSLWYPTPEKPLNAMKDYYKWHKNYFLPVIFNKKDEGKIARIITELRYPDLFSGATSSLNDNNYKAFSCNINYTYAINAVAKRNNISIFYNYITLNSDSFDNFTFFVKKEDYGVFVKELEFEIKANGLDGLYTTLMLNKNKEIVSKSFEADFDADKTSINLNSKFQKEYKSVEETMMGFRDSKELFSRIQIENLLLRIE